MECIGVKGRQLKIRMKEHKADSELDFRKNQAKRKLSGLLELVSDGKT